MNSSAPKSRWCPKCDTYWPPTGSYFSACPVCDVALKANREFGPDFETEAIARAEVLNRLDSKRKHDEFEKFYAEQWPTICANQIEQACVAAGRLSSSDLAKELS